ncbi:MAG TPA: DM13 domain-containing protein [Euzebya sp.]|nr:DM13 domain-containing protein [Euzebya sp.]
MMSRIQSPPRSPASGPDPQSHPPGRPGAAPLPRSWIVAIVVAALAFMVAVWFSNSGAIEGTLRSPQALALAVGASAVFIIAGLLLRRMGVGPAPRLLVLAVPAAVLFWLYALPSFQSGTVVNEALPGVAADDQAAAPGDVDAPAPSAKEDDPLGDGSAETPATAPTEDAAVGEPDDTAPAEELEDATPAQPTSEEPAAGPVQLTSGTFVGLDGHGAEGVAAIYRLEDGSHIVRLEDVAIQNTPAPVVYLVPGRDATHPGADFLDLGELKGEIGSSNYPIPPDADLDGDWTVLVWCSTFASPIGGATQG